MKVIVYDSKPGKGIGQWFLWLSWAVWARVLRLFGQVDKVKGFDRWSDVLEWLYRQERVSEFQYWGHGSPGIPWMAGRPILYADIVGLEPYLARYPLIWFRCCSVFAGKAGHSLARSLAARLDAIIAAHTHIIGVRQPGLHTIHRGKVVDWPLDEGMVTVAKPPYLKDLGNSIWCWQSKIPAGW